MTVRTVSVVVDNYNYERFLGDAIQSALDQTYEDTEVIVVDDGSTDGSRSVIESFGDRVIPVFKSNDGQMSAFNAGFARARGEIIIFLDADDKLFPECVSRVVDAFESGHPSKVHWALVNIDENGDEIGSLRPGGELSSGDLLDVALEFGPDNHVISPTSGNAWSRAFLERVLPMREDMPWLSGDSWLFGLAPLFGPIAALEEPMGAYRLHGSNKYSSLSFEDRLALDLKRFEARSAAMAQLCRDLGFDVDPIEWKRRSWLVRLESSAVEIKKYIPLDAAFVLIDNEEWGMSASKEQKPTPFLEQDGEFFGLPVDDQVAIAELERLKKAGHDYLVVAWPAFWWLDHYPRFRKYLLSSFVQVVSDDRLILFDLTTSPTRPERQLDTVGSRAGTAT